jgi:hypothetical protein
MKHRVLIITYLFPPSGGIGPPRYVAYCRHLRAHGCEVSVLTAKNPNTPLYDPGLLKKVPPETKVFRVFNPDVPYAFRDKIWQRLGGGKGSAAGSAAASAPPGLAKRLVKDAIQRIFNPDVQKFWVPFVLRAARKIIREQQIDVVILNTPPFSLHAIIPPLKRDFPKLKWITEVRDDWLGYYLDNFDSAKTDAKHELAVRLEGAGMRASDYVVAVTPAQRDMIRNRYKDQPAGKFLCVSNGYDADLYEGFQPRRTDPSRMVITYYGSLYSHAVYDPSRFLDAVDSLPDEVRASIDLRFVGRIASDAERFLEDRKFKISKLGFFPRAEGVRRLEESDYLLLIVNDATAHAGKLFDYLGSGLPILAVTPEHGEIAKVMREVCAGQVADSGDTNAMRTMLLEAWRRWKGEPNNFPEPNRSAAQAFERKNLVAQFVRETGLDAG